MRDVKSHVAMVFSGLLAPVVEDVADDGEARVQIPRELPQVPPHALVTCFLAGPEGLCGRSGSDAAEEISDLRDLGR
jgi:hypothetical protein